MSTPNTESRPTLPQTTADFAALVERLRGELRITITREREARAAASALETTGTGIAITERPLAERVERYPQVVALHYLAASDADDNLTRLARYMGTIERMFREELRAKEEAGTGGKMNDAKRADMLAALLERDAEYQALLGLYDEAARTKRVMQIEGDGHRRDYYNARETHWAQLKRDLIAIELRDRRELIDHEFDQRCNASEFAKNNRLDVLRAERAEVAP
jgi:hypothetical protein